MRFRISSSNIDSSSHVEKEMGVLRELVERPQVFQGVKLLVLGVWDVVFRVQCQPALTVDVLGFWQAGTRGRG